MANPIQAAPFYVNITGVAADDTLNVRAAPNAQAEDIGDLLPDTASVEIGAVDQTGSWGRIHWHGDTGWIALRFTETTDVPTLGATALPVGLSCHGTEPFWGLNLRQHSATYSTPEFPPAMLQMTETLVATGFVDQPAAIIASAPYRVAIATIRHADCTDGMSDATYPWSVDVLHQTADGRYLQSGCCHLPFDSGQQ